MLSLYFILLKICSSSNLILKIHSDMELIWAAKCNFIKNICLTFDFFWQPKRIRYNLASDKLEIFPGMIKDKWSKMENFKKKCHLPKHVKLSGNFQNWRLAPEVILVTILLTNLLHQCHQHPKTDLFINVASRIFRIFQSLNDIKEMNDKIYKLSSNELGCLCISIGQLSSYQSSGNDWLTNQKQQNGNYLMTFISCYWL